MAFYYSVKSNLRIPESLVNQNIAGADWFSSFLKRHTRLSIRTLIATNLAKASAFNKDNVYLVFVGTFVNFNYSLFAVDVATFKITSFSSKTYFSYTDT